MGDDVIPITNDAELQLVIAENIVLNNTIPDQERVVPLHLVITERMAGKMANEMVSDLVDAGSQFLVGITNLFTMFSNLSLEDTHENEAEESIADDDDLGADDRFPKLNAKNGNNTNDAASNAIGQPVAEDAMTVEPRHAALVRQRSSRMEQDMQELEHLMSRVEISGTHGGGEHSTHGEDDDEAVSPLSTFVVRKYADLLLISLCSAIYLFLSSRCF